MNLKDIREEYGLNQSEVASILGVTRSTYSVWEIESNFIPLSRLITFCNYFNCSLDYALGLASTKSYPNMKKDIDYNIHRLRLKNARKEYHYTQEYLASRMNTNNGVISRYEHGINTILTSFLIEYAKIFNISTDYLMGRIDEKINIKPSTLV